MDSEHYYCMAAAEAACWEGRSISPLSITNLAPPNVDLHEPRVWALEYAMRRQGYGIERGCFLDERDVYARTYDAARLWRMLARNFNLQGLLGLYRPTSFLQPHAARLQSVGRCLKLAWSLHMAGLEGYLPSGHARSGR